MTASTTAITVRLSPEDHKLLQLLCLVTGKSQNRLITELLAAEIDRVLPGKREAMRQPGTTLERLYAAIGTTPPAATSEAEDWAHGVIDSLRDDHDDQGRPCGVRPEGSARPDSEGRMTYQRLPVRRSYAST